MKTVEACTFTVGSLTFGLPIEFVQEITNSASLTTVPKAPEFISGLINLRGQIIAVIDIQVFFDLEGLASENTKHIILNTELGDLSLNVAAVGDVITISEETMVPVPEHLGDSLKQVIRGVFNRDNKSIFVLNLEQLLALVSDKKEAV